MILIHSNADVIFSFTFGEWKKQCELKKPGFHVI